MMFVPIFESKKHGGLVQVFCKDTAASYECLNVSARLSEGAKLI